VRLSSLAWLDRVTVFPLTPLYNLLPAHPNTSCLVEPVSRCIAPASARRAASLASDRLRL
jgi:hypothetical protein